MTAEPSRISVPDAALADLRARLGRTRWPDAGVHGWREGTDLAFLRDLVGFWLDAYDWRAEEADLNRQPQVLVDVGGGLRIHAVHRHGVGPDPMPLLLTHGWPSTFAEWRHVVDALADPAAHGGDPADAFHVVAAALPGYPCSDRPGTAGMSPRAIARHWVTLMDRLGYRRFAAHGGDWGAVVTSLIGLDAPERLVGIHLSMMVMRGSAPAPRPEPSEDRAYRERLAAWRAAEQGYVAIQATKPQTLGYGLHDSPAGLAAWVAEKWRAWTDCGGDLFDVIDRRDLLTAISLFWFTGTITSATRLYREARLDPAGPVEGRRIEVPAGFLIERPGDPTDGRDTFLGVPRVGGPPRERAERAYRVERWTVAPRGGHFPALETPGLLVAELREFFRPLRRH